MPGRVLRKAKTWALVITSISINSVKRCHPWSERFARQSAAAATRCRPKPTAQKGPPIRFSTTPDVPVQVHTTTQHPSERSQTATSRQRQAPHHRAEPALTGKPVLREHEGGQQLQIRQSRRDRPCGEGRRKQEFLCAVRGRDVFMFLRALAVRPRITSPREDGAFCSLRTDRSPTGWGGGHVRSNACRRKARETRPRFPHRGNRCCRPSKATRLMASFRRPQREQSVKDYTTGAASKTKK